MKAQHRDLAPVRQKTHLDQLSRTLLARGSYVMNEGDRWFLCGLQGAQRGAERTKAELASLRAYIAGKLNQSRFRFMRRKTPKERITKVLIAEAKRADLDVSAEQFASFCERIAVLLDLVLKGSLQIEAIAFEEGGAAVPAQPESSPQSVSSVEDEASTNAETSAQPAAFTESSAQPDACTPLRASTQ